MADMVLQACKSVSFLPALLCLVRLLCSLRLCLLTIPSAPTHHPLKFMMKQVLPSLKAVVKLESVLARVCLRTVPLGPRLLYLLISLQKVMTIATETRAIVVWLTGAMCKAGCVP